MPHDWRPSARSHTSGQSSRNFRRIPHRKTTANTSASNYDKSQPTLTANDQKTTFSDDRQHKNKMQVDIGQDRTDRTPLRRPFFRSRYNSSNHEPRLQPFADQAQDERVCNPMSNHLLQPIMLDVVKISADVGLE